MGLILLRKSDTSYYISDSDSISPDLPYSAVLMGILEFSNNEAKITVFPTFNVESGLNGYIANCPEMYEKLFWKEYEKVMSTLDPALRLYMIKGRII